MIRAARALLFALLLTAAGCSREEGGGPVGTVVRTALLERGSITLSIVVPCRLEGAEEAVVSVSTPATVTGVFVREGDRVTEGDLLVSLETDGMHEAELAAAAARLSAARAVHGYARENLDRMESLYLAGALPSEGYEEADAAERSADASVRLAETGYGLALSEASQGQVKAPFQGTVTRVWAREGDPAGGNLVAITDGEVLRAPLQLPPSVLRDLEPGLPVFLETGLFPGVLFEGSIVSVSPSIDPVSGLASATAQFTDPDGRLFSGIGGTATVALRTEPEALVLPQSAMQRTAEGGWRAVVVDADTARFVPIEVGIQEGFRWEVLSGLSEGDRIVLLGGNTVTDGALVREAAR